MRQLFGKKTILSVATLAALTAGAAQAQNDPLYRYQWHLMNYGQAVLGDTRPTFGVDIGIDDLHDYNIRGKNVVVGVLDQGAEIAHPDLAANVVPNGSWNFNNNSHDPTPVNGGAAHGTAVSGIIAAVGWNGIGVRGVAPSARLKSFNFLDAGGTSAQIQYAWWDGAESKDVQVSNNSWGDTIPLFLTTISENELAAWENPMAATRGGLGTVYVKAAGNGFNSVSTYCPASSGQVGCSQSIFVVESNYFNIITVAAVNAAGKRSSYSTPGASLWVSGLGGEYGWERPLLATQASAAQLATQPAVRFDPAIMTTDLSGCARGYNTNRVTPAAFWADFNLNRLESDQSTIDNTCNYAATMNGTSAASPTVSGVVALMLQVNPKLSYRDVKYILATTARKIDPTQAAVTNANGTVLSAGWTTNAAGRAFSNWYGYGLVDASLAVTRAGNFKSLGPLVDSGWQNVQLETPQEIGNAAAPARASVAIAGGAGRIEAVQIGLASTYPVGNTLPLKSTPLVVTLVSPSGTRAIVVPAGSVPVGDVMTFDLAAVNAFLDEPGTGNWTVEVADTSLAAGAASKGNLSSFKIRVLGH
ncbi:S8 family serine peptidase [Pseudomonas sp. CGJS7]|uniref:S8 family serine peptidase n=1 Tax=Pseudomonas sp. CGJS7 TaxID=3109348 RepID=UPI00300B2CB1